MFSHVISCYKRKEEKGRRGWLQEELDGERAGHLSGKREKKKRVKEKKKVASLNKKARGFYLFFCERERKTCGSFLV